MVCVETGVLEELLLTGLTREEDALLGGVTVDPYPEKLKCEVVEEALVELDAVTGETWLENEMELETVLEVSGPYGGGA